MPMRGSLDGDGSTTYIIFTAAAIPLYRHLQMDLCNIACVFIMSSSVMNDVQWSGATARVLRALEPVAFDHRSADTGNGSYRSMGIVRRMGNWTRVAPTVSLAALERH